ncbi:MAG: lipocalin family protein [Flavobacterium sp.]
MKKFTLLFVSVLTIGLTISSCSKDDDDDDGSLEGKWNFSKEGAVAGGQEILVDYSGNEAACTKDYITFNTGGTVTEVDYDSFDTPCEVFTDNGTWVRTNNTITITTGGESYSAEILNLTSSELKIKDIDGYIVVFTRG